MPVSIDQMYSDRYKLISLDREMVSLSMKIRRVEKMRDEIERQDWIALCDKTIQRFSDKQDDLNDQMSEILSKYEINYGASCFTVRSGNKFYVVTCDLEKDYAQFGRIKIA